MTPTARVNLLDGLEAMQKVVADDHGDQACFIAPSPELQARIKAELEQLRHQRNVVSGEIAALKKNGQDA